MAVPLSEIEKSEAETACIQTSSLQSGFEVGQSIEYFKMQVSQLKEGLSTQVDLGIVHVTSLGEKTELERKQETSWYEDWERESNSHNKKLRRDDRKDKERTLREEP